MRKHHASILRLAAGLAASCAAASGSAQTLSWTNAAGGSAATAGNWNPAQAPGAANSLLWNLLGSYTVTFPAAVPASRSHLYRRGVVTLNMTAPHTVGTSGITIGDLPGDNATVQLLTGTLNCGDRVDIATDANARGALVVSGVNSDLVMTGAGALVVGNGGQGSLTISNIGRVVASDRLLCGGGINAVGTLVVTGSQSILPFSRSTLSVLSTDESVVGMSGDASMLVDNGAIASFAGSLDIGQVLGSTASVTVEDAVIRASRMTVASDLNIGRNTTAGVIAGNGSLIVNTSATVDVGGTIHLGDDPDGGVGLLRLTGPTCSVACAGLAIGSAGTLDLQDGDLRIAGGALTPRPAIFQFAGGVAGATPVITLQNGATMTHAQPCQLGVSGDAEIRLESGSGLSASGNNITLGVNAGSRGALILTGAGTTARSSILRVGSSGLGELRIDGGASVACSHLLETGALPGADSLVEVDNGALTVGDDMVLAGRSTGPGSAVIGGHGSLTIGPAGAVNVGGFLFGMSDSTLVINGGTLNVARGVSVRTTLTNGVINAANFGSLTPVNASGRINARIAGGQFTATGDLVLGNGAPDGVDDTSVNAGAFRVDLLDSSTAEVFDLTVAGGTIAASDRLHIPPGRSLQGTGTILGGVVNDGAITSSGAAGLRFGGALVNQPDGSLAGTKLTLLPGASFSGRPAGGGKWRIEAGASAAFSLGNGGSNFIGDPSPDGFVCDGTLLVAVAVGIGDSDGFDLGPDCTLQNGAVTAFTGPFAPNGAILIGRTAGAPDVLRGVGSLSGLSVTNIGLISPGLGPAGSVGTLSIAADYLQGRGPDAGTLEIDIAGPSPDEADKLIISRSAVMDGTVRLRVPAAFHPPVGFRRTILQAASIVGGIANPDLPPQWRLERTATTLDALFCPPDFNQDGFVDFFDYDDFVQCFEAGACPPGTSADFNGDGFADFFDYDDFVLAFEHGC